MELLDTEAVEGRGKEKGEEVDASTYRRRTDRINDRAGQNDQTGEIIT